MDAAIIAAPDDLHYPITRAAINACLHMICEKPLTLNLTDAIKMCERTEQTSVINMTYFARRQQADAAGRVIAL